MPHRIAAALCAFVCTACVITPTNDMPIVSTSSTVTVQGYGLSGDHTVTLQASATADGTFAGWPGSSVQTASTAQHVVPVGNGGTASLYPYVVEARIPKERFSTRTERDGCRVSETFLRVRDGATSHVTFDTGVLGLSCVQAGLLRGEAAADALSDCTSEDSPVLRITAGAVHRGNVLIRNAADLSAARCYERIIGSLTVTAAAPHTISLPRLVQVTGDVELVYTSYRPVPDPGVSAYEVFRCGADRYVTADVRRYLTPNLREVGGNLTLRQEGSFSGTASTQPVELGLDTLHRVGGDLRITIQQFGGSPCGLSSLTTLPGKLTIVSMSGELDASITGLLPDLRDVGGEFAFEGGHNAFGNPLARLARVGSLRLVKSPGLTGFPFPSLVQVEGDALLSGLGGPSNPAALGEVGGTLTVTNTTYTSLQQVGGAALDLGGLSVSDNPSLASLHGGGTSKVSLQASAPLHIQDNPALSAMQQCAFVALQRATGWTGPAMLDAACP